MRCPYCEEYEVDEIPIPVGDCCVCSSCGEYSIDDGDEDNA